MKELINIQQELKAPKNKRNTFGNYNYRSCEDILEAVKPLLKEHGCYLLLSDDVIFNGDKAHIKATAILINEAGEKIEVSGVAREATIQKGMNDAQISGSTSSYARKYALNGLFAIDDTVEQDSQDNTTTTAVQVINKLIKTKKVDTVEFLKYFKVSAVSELSYDAQQKAIQMLEKK